MDQVKLMDRKDTKFLIPENTLPLLLNNIKFNYRVLKLNDVINNEYESQYFDTKNLTFYKQHHSGKLNRFKIRSRTYVNSKLSFLEVKFKSNRNRTIKSRIKQQNNTNNLNLEALSFIKNSGFSKPEELSPSALVKYNRVTLVENHFQERVTIDTNLLFKNNDITKPLEKLAIIEIKQNSKTNSPALNELKKQGFKPLSISKYCLAVLKLYPNVIRNNFKFKLHQINKIINDRTIYTT